MVSPPSVSRRTPRHSLILAPGFAKWQVDGRRMVGGIGRKTPKPNHADSSTMIKNEEHLQFRLTITTISRWKSKRLTTIETGH
jgi:hypothetical protein